MSPQNPPEFTDEQIERRAREAIRRSFELPYKPHKELVGKVGRPAQRKRASKAAKKPK